MNSLTPSILIQFIIVILIQLLILNNIELHGSINPFLYPALILALPALTSNWLLMTLAFILGFVIDIFAFTPGYHASATVSMAFIRIYLLKYLKPSRGFEKNDKPLPSDIGWNMFAVYLVISLIIHHIVYFSIESFGLISWFKILGNSLLHVILSLFVALIFFIMIDRKSKSNKNGFW